MNDEHRWRRKCFVICLLALFIGLMGIVLPEQEDIAFEYIVNNTDLYNNGRLQDVTYTANDSAIQLFLIFHVIGTGASLVVDTNLSINGTVVEDRDYRTTAGAGIHEHFSMTAHIPKGANYSVTNSSNLETIEWREYPIITGRNGTLSITQTGCVGDCAFNNLTVNSLGKNDTLDGYVSNINLLSPIAHYSSNGIILSQIDISDGYTNIKTTNTSTTNYSNIYKTPELLRLEVTNANNNFFEIRQNESVYDVLGRVYRYNITDFDMGGANLTNCANCGGQQNLSQVLTQGNDATFQNIDNVTGIHPLNFSVNDANMSLRVNQTTGALHANRIATFKNLTDDGPANNADNQGNFDYIFSNSQNDGQNLVLFQTISNATNAFTFFQARKARGIMHINNNTAMVYPLVNGDIIFRIMGTGYNGNGWGGTRSYIDLIAAGDWNTTSMPTMIEFGTNDISGSVQPQFRVYPNGSIQLVRMVGSSKTYLCQENGFITAGTPGC